MLNRTRVTRHDDGFSFIELLAYMAIAALLILAAIPQFNAYRQKAVVSDMQGDLHNAATAMEGEATADLTYPTALPASMKVSPGVTLKLARSDSDGYCITGTTSAGTSWHYDSQEGTEGAGACSAVAGPGGGFTAAGICTYDAKVQHVEEVAYEAFSSNDWIHYLKSRTHTEFAYVALQDGKISQDEYNSDAAEESAAQNQWYNSNATAQELYYYASNPSGEFTSDEQTILNYLDSNTYPTSWGFIADDSNSEFVSKIPDGTTTYTEAQLLKVIDDNQTGWGAKLEAVCQTPQSTVLGS